jgi:hypothetical protein
MLGFTVENCSCNNVYRWMNVYDYIYSTCKFIVKKTCSCSIKHMAHFISVNREIFGAKCFWKHHLQVHVDWFPQIGGFPNLKW